jgi:uncharacterized circularly permuted ATP-grasp superfamily protein
MDAHHRGMARGRAPAAGIAADRPGRLSGNRRGVRADFYDEAFVSSGVPRAEYAAVLEALYGQDLGELARAVEQAAARRAVSFGEGDDTAFVLDPVPRILTAGEWRELEAGLIQRVRALDAFVADAYGDQRIVTAGVVPAYVIESAEYHEAALAGTGERMRLAIAGLDVVRDHQGRFLVLEDNVRTPSGVAYALAARELVDACLRPPVDGRRSLDDAWQLVGGALRAAAPGGAGDDTLVAVLSDGPDNTAFWEHRAIADHLGLALVAIEDLDAGADGLYARVDGRRARVDVVYRRTTEDRLTGDDGRPSAVGEVLLGPWQRGQVGLVNPFGAGVADDKLAHAYVEDMVHFYLGQEPLVGSVHTYDLAVPAVRDEVLSRVDDVVIKPREGSGGHGVLIGPHADEPDRADTADDVRARPEGYVAQEVVRLSRHPTVIDGTLAPRHVDLRAFVFLAGDEATVLPGGLTRVALDAGALVVNSSQNGGAKDTWVLP